MSVNGDTGEVTSNLPSNVKVSQFDGHRKLAQGVETALNAFQWPDDGTYEDMYFQLNSEVATLIKNLRKALFRAGAGKD